VDARHLSIRSQGHIAIDERTYRLIVGVLASRAALGDEVYAAIYPDHV